MSFVDKLVAFERDKLKKQIAAFGKEFIFSRYAVNDFNEPVKSLPPREVCTVNGIYHDSFNSYVSRNISDGATVAKTFQPMLLCLFEDAALLNKDDFIEIGEKVYKVVSIKNINNLNYGCEVSFEVDNG